MSLMQFRPARRSEAKPLLGFYSESGGGKTMSALLVARGFVGPQGRIGMIETEGGRGEAYADAAEYAEIGGYDVLSLRDNFSPASYGDALKAAEAAKLDALIIDSASHEWESTGGVLEMAANNIAAGRTGVLVWQQPKMLHQRHFMIPLLKTPIALVIVCLRAKYPMREIKKPDGSKTWVRSETLEPKQSDDILFELFTHGWFDQSHNFHLTQCRSKSMEPIFAAVQPLTNETGKRLAEWARGAPVSSKSETTGGTEFKPPNRDWARFGTSMTERVNSIEDVARLDSLISHNAAHLAGYQEWNAGKYQDLMALVAARKTELLNKETV